MIEPLATVAAALAQVSGAARALSIDLALRQSAGRARRELALLAELVWLAHTEGVWSHVERQDGLPYLTEEDYYEEVLHLGSWRSVYRYLAAGRLIAAVPENVKAEMRRAVEAVGVVKAAIIAPAIEADLTDAARRARFFRLAATENPETLQRHVNDARARAATESPRSGAASTPDRLRVLLLNMAPSIETREVLEDFLAVGARFCETDSTIGIVIRAAQECLNEWTIRGGRAVPEGPPSVAHD